ncbi:class I SAM-dependent methyltransferase [Streptomyces sp. NPDC002746]
MEPSEFDHVPAGWADTFFDGGFEDTFRRRGSFGSTAQDIDDLCASPLLSATSVRILDVACGFGRHASLLADRGHSVVGIDASVHQIKRAQELHPHNRFAVGDMLEPPEGPFDVILNLWTSFGILPSDAEDLAALTAWCQVLTPSGALILDLSTQERTEHLNRRADEPVTTKEVTRQGVTTEARYDWRSGVSYVRYSRPGWSRWSRTRMYSCPELAEMLQAAGFAAVGYWGDFRLGPVDPAKRLVVVARPGMTSESTPHRLGG